MREPIPGPGWPISWTEAFKYDREEVFGVPVNRGLRLVGISYFTMTQVH